MGSNTAGQVACITVFDPWNPDHRKIVVGRDWTVVSCSLTFDLKPIHSQLVVIDTSSYVARCV